MAFSDMRSSPARSALFSRSNDFSSSPLLDVKDLDANKPANKTLRSGRNAASIPKDAISTFVSASDLLRSANATGHDLIVEEPELPIPAKAPKKRSLTTAKPNAKWCRGQAAKEVVVLSSDGPTAETVQHDTLLGLEPGKQIEEGVDDRGGGNESCASKPWKKYKASADPTQPSLKGEDQAAQTERPVEQPSKARKHTNKSKYDTASEYFATESSVVAATVSKRKRLRTSTPEPMNLEVAVHRKTDWTPPKPDTIMLDLHSIETPSTIGSSADCDMRTEAAELFKKLRDTYGHKAVDTAIPVVALQPAPQVLGHRKSIELVAVNSKPIAAHSRSESSPSKEKAPKKKPRTITELAVAAYAPHIETTNPPPKEDSVLDYFTVENDATEDSSNIEAVKGKGKVKKAPKRKGKTPAKQALLLSPQSAMRQSDRQDFIFGTSSQLAREQSPTFLKDLHKALKASSIMEEDMSASTNSFDGARTRSNPAGKGLWSVSARDDDGDMLDVNVIDLIESPEFPKDDAILDPWKQLSPDAAGAETKTHDSSVVGLSSRQPPHKEGSLSDQLISVSSLDAPRRRITINSVAMTSQDQSDEFPLVTDLLEQEEMPPPSNQQQTQEEVKKTKQTRNESAKQAQRPKYELFTDAKLAKEISRYGFKAVKTRSGMISLLDMCWKSKNQAVSVGAAFSTSALTPSPKRKTTAPSPAQQISPSKKPRAKSKTVAVEAPSKVSAAEEETGVPPKRKRGRPRKDATITDSTESSMPPPAKVPSQLEPGTPKRRKVSARTGSSRIESELESDPEDDLSSPDKLFSPGKADVSISEDTEISLNLSPQAQQSTLFSLITKAVTSAPRTTDPENPSWHEKMLMYDPIIIEDLTAWLNSGQLTKVGHDEEVAPGDVKKWCESRSICCLWRINLHGKERKRF